MVQPFGAGHVHDTFQVQDAHGTSFLLQRINHAVFADVKGMMRNIERVTRHIRQKIITLPKADLLTTFELVLTTDQQLFHRDDSGNYWRALTFVERGTAYRCGAGSGPCLWAD